ncbi:bifunctional 2-polyprenyl-6-hydroxyphenol methylase/3-demethylubiquinol 3-O-methyltransferase UbiG [Geobacter sp. DSM 9736]|uniref:class I SAM-dependent methyltransferase n=1 Tax=Geobacter sp. DSM 9736 TaxID=1277350 RepID=UPI000B50DB20|nr:class I SAM-dependent methyltransferase [Geobacter sp. DSM 9736]SNB47723.1 Methyltransferase domain-containing protein [Geobacter sp. DSM 9736]
MLKVAAASLMVVLAVSAGTVLGEEASPQAGNTKVEVSSQQRMKALMERIFSNSTSSRSRFDPSPNAFLVEVVQGLKPGRALDVGMGQGRNALYLAGKGWEVTGFDISPTGIRQAREQALKLGVKLQALERTDADFDFGIEKWDMIVLCYVDFRHLMERIRSSLKPGGVVVIETYHRDTSMYRPIQTEKAFSNNELILIFGNFRILRYEDVPARPDWNFTGEEKHRVVRLLAQKPDPSAPVSCFHNGKAFAEKAEVCDGEKKLVCSRTGWQRKGNCK